MASEASRPVWPLALIAAAAIAFYLYSSIEVRGPASPERPVGGLADVKALADRDDTNILFILIDTLRAERMGAYGYERDTTPFLSKLADTGIRFDHNIAQSSWTKSSMASMWTGLNPIRSGVTKFNHTVSSDVIMPAEVLQEAGFKNVGLYRNGWVHGYFGFDQGFEKYYRPLGLRADPEVFRNRPNAVAHGNDEGLMKDAIEFLRIHGESSRWFLYLHLMDLHEYTYDAESAIFGNKVGDLYDNSILRTDWVVSTLYAYLAKKGLLDDTIVVVLSDHGEAFGERGFEGHARTVFPETTETPLIISLPFDLEEPVRVDARTANIDVWPTLLELTGLDDTERETDGVSRMPELLAAFEGGATPDADKDIAVAFLDENWGHPNTPREPAVSVLEGAYRFVTGRDHSGRRFETLLSLDDNQQVNLIEEHPEIAERLREKVAGELELDPLYESDTYELDEMQLDQLRALGYELP